MIRAYHKSDWNEVCRIYDSSKPLELASTGIEASFVPLANDDVRIGSFNQSTILVCLDEGSLSGFVGYDENQINWLFVDPVAFRRGIARALLRSAVHRVKGDAWLWVAEGNAPAVALYYSEGFEAVERRELTNNGLSCRALRLLLRREVS